MAIRSSLALRGTALRASCALLPLVGALLEPRLPPWKGTELHATARK